MEEILETHEVCWRSQTTNGKSQSYLRVQIKIKKSGDHCRCPSLLRAPQQNGSLWDCSFQPQHQPLSSQRHPSRNPWWETKSLELLGSYTIQGACKGHRLFWEQPCAVGYGKALEFGIILTELQVLLPIYQSLISKCLWSSLSLSKNKWDNI